MAGMMGIGAKDKVAAQIQRQLSQGGVQVLAPGKPVNFHEHTALCRGSKNLFPVSTNARAAGKKAALRVG
jgi:hypothetical protein